MRRQHTKWTELKARLVDIEAKLQPETLEKEFGVTAKTINIVKNLLKGENIPIADLSESDLLALHAADKLSDKIQLVYVSESASHWTNKRII